MEANVHIGHRRRLKERYLKEGLDFFEDHQLLELLLFYAIPYKDTNNIAHRLLDKFGSLAGVFEAEPKEIAEIKGLGENSALLISLIPHIARRYFKDRWKEKPQIKSSSDAGEYAVSLFVGRKYESFFVVCLNSQNKVNYADMVHEGSINEAVVYPRLVVESALRHQAASVIIAHNHPGGSLKPSMADIDITDKIKTSLESISIRVLDHIIVSGDKYLSFAQEGYIK